MPYSRVLLVVDSTADADGAEVVLATARRVAPEATHVHRVALAAPDAADVVKRHPHVEPCFDVAQLSAIARRERVDLVVAGPWPAVPARARALALVEFSAAHDFDVLVIGARCRQAPRGEAVGLSFDSATGALGPATAAVRGLAGVRRVVALVRSATAAQLEDLDARLRALLPGLAVECAAVPASLSSLAEDLEREAAERALDLVVVATDELWRVQRWVAGLASAEALQHAERPLLLLRQTSTPALLASRLSASDVFRAPGRPLPVHVERTTEFGRRPLEPQETFVVVGAEARGALPHDGGRVEVPESWLPRGADRFALASSRDPAQVATVRILDAPRPVLFASDVPEAALPDLEAFAARHMLVAVRLRADETLEGLRRRLDALAPWGGPVPVVDASALLDDGGAGDVPRAVDAVRLVRCAHRLVADGVLVRAVVTAGPARVESHVVRVWTPEALRRRAPTAALGRRPPTVTDAAARWNVFTASAPVLGHRVALEFDGGAARRRLLDGIAAARERVHWQSYIVEDDGTAAAVSDALQAAAARGVRVRVLVDSLYSLHEVYGVKNPVLSRLAETPGIEVRSARPLSGLPSIEGLKARNHRKLVVVDGREATVTGRNLGDVYYRGFDEQQLSADTPFAGVPWLDASAVIEGPLVEAVERCFLDEWVRCGGAPFEVAPQPPVGPLTCRFIAHEGLVDAHTFDALLELLRSAHRRVVLVNTFPLAVELQRAVLSALRRGVEVTLLFGNVRPRWGDGLPFAGGALRELGDELVRARLEPLLRAGAAGYEFALPDGALGQVFPHVHAKLYLADEARVLVGTANLDVTSGYWESEALVAVEDAAFTRAAQAAVERLLATSRRVDPDAPAWARAAARRAWLSEYWPNLVG